MNRPDPNRPVIHWVSPLPPAPTDIAHYTARILPAMAQVARVVLWTDVDTWDRDLENHALICRLDSDRQLPKDFEQAAQLAGAPAGVQQQIFIHIGNSWLFHANFLRLARRIPAVVVLHDLAIQEMLNDAIDRDLFDAESYRTEMGKWYGTAGAEAAEICLAGDGRDAQKLAPHMPGFELALPRAHSVLTHTDAASAAVRGHEIWPVQQLELPFQAGPPPDPRRGRFGPLRLLQFGYIGPNRRLFEVLEALSGIKDTVDFRFDVMGNVWDPTQTQQHILRLGLQSHVHLHGFVSEPDLDQALREAHLVFNLRHPTLGEASGSQLRIWNAGAAAVVRDAGWYKGLPEGTVFKIADDNDSETEALQNLITRVAQDRDMIRALSQKGYARLIDAHGSEDYVQSILSKWYTA